MTPLALDTAHREPPRRRRFGRLSRLPLGAKLALAFVGLVAFALIVNGVMEAWLGYDQARETALHVQRDQAEVAADHVEAFLGGIEIQLRWTTGAEWGFAKLEQQRYDFIRLLRETPAITSLAYIDGHGREQLAVSRLEPDAVASGKDLSGDPRFLRAVADKVWFGPVEFRRGSEPYMAIAVAHVGKTPGVTVADVNLKLVWDVVSAIHVGEKGFAYVVDEKGRLIADPDLSLVLRDTDLSALPQVKAALAALGAAPADRASIAGSAAVAKGRDGGDVLTAYAIAEKPRWIVFVQQPLAEALAPVTQAILRTLGLLGLGLLLAVGAGTALARRMTAPIRALQRGAEELGAGDLGQRIEVSTGDEIEALAGSFNAMAGRLKESYETLEARVEARTEELNEALRRQTATSDVLRAIAASPSDIAPALAMLAETVCRLCRAYDAVIMAREGERLRVVAHHGPIPLPPNSGGPVSRDWPPGRAVLEGEAIHVADLAAAGAEFPRAHAMAVEARAQADVETPGLAWRTVLVMPLKREGAAIGMIALRRRDVSPFSDAQAALLATFADQAAIAVENARLFRETQEALERQTATAEILKVIAASPSDAGPVFTAIAETANRLLGGFSTAVWRFDGDQAHLAAFTPVSPEADAALRALSPRPVREFDAFAPLLVGDIVHFPDTEAQPAPLRDVARTRGYRANLFAPLMLRGEAVGFVSVTRRAPGAFDADEIALLRTFADQAVIAIENARLFNETREALERQTATADVLKVISRSVADAAPVFEAILESCQRLLGLESVAVYLVEGDSVRGVAQRGWTGGDWGRDAQPLAGSSTGLAIADRRAIHIPNLADQPNFPEEKRKTVLAGGGLTVLYAPMLLEERGVGSIVVAGRPARPFSANEIALAQSFADQAAIAIQNARLFEDVQARTRDLEEALAQQTATADVLKVISRSTFDLQTVLDTLAASAVSLCGARSSIIYLKSGDGFELRAVTDEDAEPDLFRRMREAPLRPGRGSVGARVLLTGEVQNVADIEADPDYDPERRAMTVNRALLGVPLKRGDDLVGAFVLARPEPGLFTERQIQIVRTFADQAVIAIENVRLFNETQEALERERAAAEILGAVSQSVADAEPVFDEITAACARLFGTADAAIWRIDDDGMVRQAAGRGELVARGRDDVTPLEASYTGRVARTRQVLHIPDQSAEPDLSEAMRERLRLAGGVSLFYAPIVAENRVIGSLGAMRSPPRPFSDKELALAKTFADQAAIAIQNAKLFRETNEALQHQVATSEVLQAIGRSMADAQPVFERIVETLANLLPHQSIAIFLAPGDGLVHLAARRGPRREEIAALYPRPIEGSAVPTVLETARQTVYPDLLDGEGVPASLRRAAAASGNCANVVTPMVWQGRGVGMITVAREVGARFGERELSLLRTFADQAVIAIENARLFGEVQARTRDLQESLAQQTATADVLKVISRSAFDLQTVLDALVASAIALCGARSGLIFLKVGDGFELRAMKTDEPIERELFRKLREKPLTPGRGSVGRRVLLTGEVHNIADVRLDPDFDPGVSALMRNPAALGVPLKRGDDLVGAFVLARAEPGLFSERQVQIVQTFADQAVIAIENARLFHETQESLAQQTATADVLQTISRSVFDLETVLRTLIDTAVRLCRGSRGTIFIRNGDTIEASAFHSNVPPGMRDHLLANPRPLDGDGFIAASIREGRIVHLPDLVSDRSLVPEATREHAAFGAVLCVPLMREGEAIGCFAMPRNDPVAFTAREIELVKTFADQAVIAIENARLFAEVQAKTRDLEESLAQQTATADVLKTISRSMLDLDTVLQSLIDTAVRLAHGSRGTIFVRRGDVLVARAFHSNVTPELRAYFASTAFPVDGDDSLALTAREGQVVQYQDLSGQADPFSRAVHSRSPAGAGLLVPLIGEGRTLGVFAIRSEEAVAFTDREIELVKTFADQAVIAIENARLFDEVQARTRELARSLEDLRRAQDRLVQSEKLASLGQLTAGIAHEIKNPLNFVNNFSALSRELLDELGDIVRAAPLEPDVREEAVELIEMTQGNLDKVVSHGQRADSIVKNMLLHARQGSTERSRTGVNGLVEEALNLAFHGARAEKPGFNVAIGRDFDPAAGEAELYPQEVTRVLLNLISNGFYATMKRKQAGELGYEPTLAASTRDLGDSVEIVIRDNGTGIPEDAKAKLFNPFFTTKPAGEGTGLGLSLSHDIVVKQHGGSIDVESEPGSTAFIVRLPRSDASPGAAARRGG